MGSPKCYDTRLKLLLHGLPWSRSNPDSQSGLVRCRVTPPHKWEGAGTIVHIDLCMRNYSCTPIRLQELTLINTYNYGSYGCKVFLMSTCNGSTSEVYRSSVWVMQVWSLSSCKLCLASFLAEMSSLFCLLASGRACASHAFLQCWPSTTRRTFNCPSCHSIDSYYEGPGERLVRSGIARHTAAGLSCIDIASMNGAVQLMITY